MENKSLSIVIATFNNVKFIDESLTSITNNCNNIEYEILVGIDGCEKTLEYVNENYKNNDKIKFYFFSETRGPFIVKNTLISETKYENILFFDSDDILMNDSINLIMKYLQEYEVVRFNFLNFNEPNRRSLEKSTDYANGVFAIKKYLFIRVGGFEPWLCGADTEFGWRVDRNTEKIKQLQNHIFYRRRHPDSLTRKLETSLVSKTRAEYRKIMYKKVEDNTICEPITLFKTTEYKLLNSY